MRKLLEITGWALAAFGIVSLASIAACFVGFWFIEIMPFAYHQWMYRGEYGSLAVMVGTASIVAIVIGLPLASWAEQKSDNIH